MENSIHSLMEYLDGAHSVFHAVELLRTALEARGYERLELQESWDLVPGGCYYTVRGGSALMAFRVPEGESTGFMLSAAHADRPAFKLKENGELTGTYTRLSLERYGGMIIAPWLDRPLSVAGRVVVDEGGSLCSRLVDIDRDLMLIPNVAIHMNRAVNDGYKWDMTRDVLPLLGGSGAAGKLETLLEEAAGGPILGRDLYTYVRQKAALWGVDGEYISAPALDDLACVWGCAQGFLKAEKSSAVPVLCVFDNEEVGSASGQGADSDLMATVLERIACGLGRDLSQLLACSMLVSADNAHALHPNHPELSDAKNAPVLGGGPVIKFAASQSYTTDGLSAALFRTACSRAGVKTQTYFNRADLPGGGTLGRYSLTQVSVPSVDIGLPQLAMHSCYETCAADDCLALEKAMAVYFSCSLHWDAQGNACLKS